MSNDDLELDGFDYGDGTELDSDFEEHLSDNQRMRIPTRQDVAEARKQPRDNQGTGVDETRRQPRNSQTTGVREERRRQTNVVQVTGSVDRGRMRSQQRVNRQNPTVRSSNQAQQTRHRQVNMEQIQEIQEIQEQPPTKKKSKLPLILVPVILLAIVIGVVAFKGSNMTPQEENYAQSGRFAYDNLLTALKNYDATQVDAVVGFDNGDSYLAQEWSYANNNSIRQDFIISICANLDFTYPQVNQLSTDGSVMRDVVGNPLLVLSSMNNGENVTVTHVDYENLSATMQEDKEVILELYSSSGISEDDYDYEEEMVDLMLDYIVSKGNLPTTTTDIALGVSLGASPIISDDKELDKLLFSSDEFHNMCDVFSQVVTGFTGYETEKYTVKEEQPNPEYTQWKMRFDAYYEADDGKFIKGVSKWEPWYLRDANNNYILDANGEKIVNYYSVKDDQGNDWIQPSKTVIVDVEKERQVEVDWVKDSVIPYCFMGAYYCQNEYTGDFSPEVRVGDGTIEHPAGVGTPIITKCLGTDGNYHDVKVTMTGYWIGQDAIDYAISFSEKNRGFDINSVIQIICYEIKVENLEDKAFTFKSDMFLSDKGSNKSARTGTMYGFYDTATVEAGNSVIINDWATSTELEQKYACWGSSFSRVYDVVYFKVLAGEGNVPTYSAYKAFTGESEVTGMGS